MPAQRGAIVDRRGEPLALSAPVESLWAVPQALLDAPRYVDAVAKLLGRQPSEFRKYLQARASRKFVYISDPLSPAEAKRSEEHTSELQSLMRISYAVFCLKKKNTQSIIA